MALPPYKKGFNKAADDGGELYNGTCHEKRAVK
jgi:hypothetical protein